MSEHSELIERVASAAAQWSQSDGGQVFVSRDLLRRAATALRELEAENERLERLLGGVRNDMAAASKLVDSLQAKLDRLRELVREAYSEGYEDGAHDESFGKVKDWLSSETRAKLEGK